MSANDTIRIVRQHKGIWELPPAINDTNRFSDAPLLGNGDVGIIVLGTIDAFTFVAGKNEFISLEEGRPKAMAAIELRIPGMAGASHHVEQEIAVGKVNGTFTLDGNTIRMTSWVQATDSSRNLCIVTFTYTGQTAQQAMVQLRPGLQNNYGAIQASIGHILYQDVRADHEDLFEGTETCRVRMAARIVGTTGTVSGGTLQWTMLPGGVYSLVTCIMSQADDPAFKAVALDQVNGITELDIEAKLRSHEAWWESFWSQSFVEIPNKSIEKQYYGSLYLLASCMREGEMAPGLYGNWLIKDPAWGGTPPLNYNYQAPYFCTIPTNHIELAANYEKVIMDWVPTAEANAAKIGHAGVYYEAYIGLLPRGPFFSSYNWTGLDHLDRDCFMMQKSNAVFAAIPMILRYYYTSDLDYAKDVYEPFLKKVADFWISYLRWDGRRYVIDDDYVHEGPNKIGPQTNPLTSLGFVRLLFQALIEMSIELGTDEAQRAIWQNRLDHLSDYPTFVRNGRTVFRNQESGTSEEWTREYLPDEDFSVWSTPCAIPEMALMYPGSQIGLLSDPALLEIAQETVKQQAKWEDDNMICFFYPSAARVGHDPADILQHLEQLIAKFTYPNMVYSLNGGGIENFNAVPALLTEMFVQSHQHKLHVFPNWLSAADAAFGDLMAYGGFLVSSRIAGDVVQEVKVLSRKGRCLTLFNPWPNESVRVYRNGVESEVLSGGEITAATSEGEELRFVPI
ncbi:glycosyl hydrolase family 95 catalytic domain-containing protein [Paenibacillus sp. HJGM_3]|uniref:glycosyl hydrolase family 95 catalytic domain-containing protein n=1 Tax=Paenibacillus sp. HJGM_3 TaxID=3379816 RepID=UPI00385AF8E0